MQNPYRRDVPDEILHGIGAVVPTILREAIDHGVYLQNTSRDADPSGYPDYSEATRANMRYCRIAAVLRELVTLAQDSMPELEYRVTPNKRSTEVLLNPYFGFKINRAKQNRAGRTTGVNTKRRRILKTDSPIVLGQIPLQWADGGSAGMGDEGRVWVTTTFDMDELEEQVTKVFIGVEARKKFFWRSPLLPADGEVLASLPLPLVDHIVDLRTQRA